MPGTEIKSVEGCVSKRHEEKYEICGYALFGEPRLELALTRPIPRLTHRFMTK